MSADGVYPNAVPLAMEPNSIISVNAPGDEEGPNLVLVLITTLPTGVIRTDRSNRYPIQLTLI